MTDPACFCQKITPLQTIRSAAGPTKLQDWRIAVISRPSQMLDGLPRAIAVAEVLGTYPWNELGSMRRQRKSSATMLVSGTAHADPLI